MLGDEAGEVRGALPHRPSEGLGHVFCRRFFGQRWGRFILADSLRLDYCRVRAESGRQVRRLLQCLKQTMMVDETRVELVIGRSGQILNMSKVEIIGFVEGSDVRDGNEREAKENAKAVGLNICKDTVPI